MPLPGDSADKFGNRYEGRWTVSCLAEILDERADSISLQPPDPEGEGVEFWLRKGDIKEYHQVKRQHGSRNYWSISALGQAGVLQTFLKKLGDEKACCVFVSANSTELDELCDRAVKAASFAVFKNEFIQAKHLNEKLNQLRQKLDLQSLEDVYLYLRRVRVDPVGEDILVTFVKSRLAKLVEGDPANVLDVLAQFALEKVNHELTAFDLWNHLESRGYRRRQWAKDPHVLAAVDDANNRYLSNLREEAISGEMISRDETHQAIGILTSSSGKSSALLVGEAGVGKSSVIYEVVEALQNQGWPVVAFRVDHLIPTQLPDDVGKQSGLPGSPAHVLAAIALGRDCALVIDQLDAVSLASGRHIQFFECINEIIKQAQAHTNIHLILACRKFDLDNDDRLKQLKDDQGVASVVAINRLSHTTVKRVVAGMGLEENRLTVKQLDLLSVPLHLKLLADAAKDSSSDALDFQTANDLYGKFCLRKQAAIREAIGRPVQWNAVIGTLCDYLSDRQVLYAPKLFVEEKVNPEDARAMASWHVLIDDGKQYAFFHESFFDYAFARRFVSSNQRLIDFLQSSQQHLFRRAQVRQILLHQREADRARYLDDLKALLASPEIRFHIKDTALACISGTDAQRIGAAEIFSANLHLERFRSFCSQTLIKFFSDPNEEVRLKAANCFHRLEGEQLEEQIDLIEAFIESPAFAKAHSILIETLGKTASKLPDVTYKVCERFIDLAGSDTADFRTRTPMDSAETSKLLIRLYIQASDQSLQSRCLDLIDRMIETGSYGLNEALDLYER